jgi:mannose-6-phosphate isomerase-like protein (cupin superfamily)
MYKEDLEKLAEENTNFRKVLYTGKYSQIVAMNIPVGEDIGEEVHPDTDQILYFVDGDCEAIVNGEVTHAGEDDVVFVPAGAKHNFKNTGDEDLKLFTIYAPPHHPDGTIHATKKDAKAAELEEDSGI